MSAKPTEKNSPQYYKEREQARSENDADRRKLAGKKTTRPEILYYLASDKDEAVRTAVAKNKATPGQADMVLAGDKSDDVRLALAKRLTDLLPHLSEDKQSEIYAFAVKALVTLARDEVLKVRLALSSTLKDKIYTPPVVAARLAKDAEREVAEPMLRFCVALSDDDLLEIISDHPEPWVLSAIAQREAVSEDVSDAVIESENNEEAGQILIGNKGARFYEKTLEFIVEKASQIPSWQAPLVKRKHLPLNLAKELAGFVDVSLLKYLEKRSDFDKKEKADIVETVRRRIDFETKLGSATGTTQEKVMMLYERGELSEELVQDALSWHQNDFVIASLSLMARIPEAMIKNIIDAAKPKPIVALCWRAGLAMRTAVKVQRDLARINQKDLLLAKGGTDYPLSEDDMAWQLEFLGVDNKQTQQ